MDSGSLSRMVPIDQAMPGMVLAADVRLRDGSMLLPAGFQIGAPQIEALRQRDIRELAIVVPPAEAGGDPSAARQAREEAVRKEVAHMFRKSESDSATQALNRAVLEYRLEGIE